MPLKPFGSREKLFTPDWVEAVGAVQTMGHEAEVRLVSYHRDGEINPSTGMKDVRTEVHWPLDKDTVSARIQPIHNPTYMSSPAVDTIVKRVRIQMDRISIRIDLGWEIEVVSCDSNPTLETYHYTNMEAINSSNNVDTTLLFQVNPREIRGD